MPSAKSSSQAKVVVIDDHPIVLAAIQGICMTVPNLEFAGAASSVAEAGALLSKVQPTLAIVDMTLSDGDGFDLISLIQGSVPGCRLLVFSAQEDPTFAERALKKGAHGYLLKGGDIPEIREAIEVVLGGNTFISPELAQIIAYRQVRGVSQEDPTTVLTTREFQIFQHLGAGKKSAEIAEMLSISPRTVDTHRENLKNKLKCQSATDVIIKAREWMNGSQSS